MMGERRSKGILIIAITNTLIGVYGALLMGPMLIYDIFAFFKYQSMDLIGLIFDTLFFIAPIYVIISGICLHKLQRQWIVSNIVIAVFGILLLIFLYLIPDIRIVPNATMEIEALLFRIILFSLIIYFIWSIIYLTCPKVRALFSPERGEAESKGTV